MISIIIVYAVGLILMYGMWLAFLQGEFPLVAQDCFYYDMAFSILWAILWPASLVPYVIMLLIGFKWHGFLYRNPHNTNNTTDIHIL